VGVVSARGMGVCAWEEEVEEERQVSGGSVSAWYGGVCVGGGGGGGKTGGWGERQCVVWGVCAWEEVGMNVSTWYGRCVCTEKEVVMCICMLPHVILSHYSYNTHTHTPTQHTHPHTHTHTSTCTISSHTTHTYLNRDIQFSSTNGEVCSE